jgi:hypothetical protein
MERFVHLDLYDTRRGELFSDIECRECAHYGPTCGNAVVVLDAVRSRGNDMSIPMFDFTPDGDLNASQCPGMWPSAGYLRATGQTQPTPWENRVDQLRQEAKENAA